MVTKVLIVGYGRAGKDEAGNWLAKYTTAKFGGSTSLYLLDHMTKVQNLPREACYANRHATRQQWFEEGNKLRDSDPSFLIRAALANGNVIAGVRDGREIQNARSQQLVDVIVWIDNPRVPVDPTVEFTESDCDLTILNESDLATYYRRLAVFAKLCGFEVKGEL